MAKVTRRIGVLATVLLGAAVVGCSGSSASAPAPATAGSAVAANDLEGAGLREHHRYHHHGGVTLFIAMGLDTLGVAPERRAAVEKIRTDLQARMAPARTAEQNLVTALADGLAAGSFDAAKVDAAVAQATAAAAAVHDASIEALNQLHAVLTPPERAALVDKVEAHWAVWKKTNADDLGSAQEGAGHVSALARDLDLTPDQADKIRAGLREGMKGVPRLDSEEVTTYLRAFGEAFRGETFDAKALTAANGANTHLAGWGAAHMARFVETASPVLSPDQRTKLAERLREHATHGLGAQETP